MRFLPLSTNSGLAYGVINEYLGASFRFHLIGLPKLFNTTLVARANKVLSKYIFLLRPRVCKETGIQESAHVRIIE
jgi:hypothetical protein